MEAVSSDPWSTAGVNAWKPDCMFPPYAVVLIIGAGVCHSKTCRSFSKVYASSGFPCSELLCWRMLPFLLVELLWVLRHGLTASFVPLRLLMWQVHFPSPNLLFNHLFTLFCLSRISPPSTLSLLSITLSLAPALTPPPRPIEGRMRRTERTSRVPHAVCTITCTAFTCPVSTAVAPATVAKLACPLQHTLSAMPPSLNTCELAACWPDQHTACNR